MNKLDSYRKQIRQFLKLGKKFQELGLIDDMANKTFAKEYQRRPASIVKYMAKLGLDENSVQ